MLASRNHDPRRGGFSCGLELLRRWCHPGAAILSLGLALTCSSCKKKSTQAHQSPPEVEAPALKTEISPESKQTEVKKTDTSEGYATWYDVPANSLTKRRAGKDEITAAHIRLPLGTVVRVTHLANGKSVIVRITDRCVSRRATIDLSREAAEKLEMISEGSARVRLEVLPDDKATAAVPESTTSTAHP